MIELKCFNFHTILAWFLFSYVVVLKRNNTAKSILQAVNNFYCNSSVQQEIHHWLTTAQVSTAAWSFSWELLAPEKVC